MAQTLVDDCSYSLLTKEHDIEKRNVYFVKLTDSSLKAIEEYLLLNNGPHSKAKPCIKFDSLNGLITIPGRSDLAHQHDRKSFQFEVSALQASNQGMLECICQPNLWEKDLVSYGTLQSKIAVKATNESFETTRNRMAQTDQERKEVRTKEIKLNQVKKRAKKKMQMLSQDSLSPKVTSMKRPAQAPTSSSASLSVPIRSSPVPSINRNSPASSQKSFTFRDRIIHILAIQPYKKSELLARLRREAALPKDSVISLIVQQVSSMKDHEFHLNADCYNELQPDSWPFYKGSEREKVKENIRMMKIPSAPDDSTSPQMVTSSSQSPEEKGRGDLHVDSTTSSKKMKYEFTDDTEPSSTSSSLVSSHKSPQSTETRSNYEEDSPPTVASTSLTPEYLKNYKRITTYEQRCLYKQKFQLEYPEYRRLKAQTDAVTQKFVELDASWKKAIPGTVEHERIHDEICDRYEECQKDEEYIEKKKRCHELDQKLRHIKSLIVEYDAMIAEQNA